MDARLDAFAGTLLSSAKEVRRELGVGLTERVYLECLAAELRAQGIDCATEVPVPIIYKGTNLGRTFRIDLLIEDAIVVEGKAAETLIPAHFAQLLTYLRLSGRRLGFLINFHAVPFATGIHRRVLTKPS